MATPERSMKPNAGGTALAWSGDDPVAYSRAVAALEEVGIRIYKITEHDPLVFQSMQTPWYAILVARSDAKRAEAAVREALDVGEADAASDESVG
jgi:hypothetical protein